MASLGDVLLGVAGGVAEGYNQEIDKRRDSDRKMLENANTLMMQSRYKVEETKALKEYEQNRKRRDLQEFAKNQPEGINSAAAQYHYATQYLGWDEDRAAKAVHNNTIKVPEDFLNDVQDFTYQPASVFDDLGASMQSAQGKARAAALKEKYGVVAQEATRTPFNVPDSIKAMDQKRMAEKALLDEAGLDKSLAAMEQARLAFGPDAEDMKYQWDTKRGVMIATNPNTNESFVITPEGLEKGGEEAPKESDTMMGLNKQLAYYKKQKEAGKTDMDYDYAIESTVDLIEKKRKESGLTESDLANRNRIERRVGDIRAQLTQLSTMQKGITQFKETSSARGEGVPGMLLNAWNTIGHNIRGFAEMTGAVDRRSLIQMEQELIDAGINIDEWIKKDASAAAGANRTDKVTMLYGLASINKNFAQERLSNQDTAYAMDALSGFGDEGRLAQVTRIEQKLNDKIAAYNLEYYTMEGVTPQEKRDAGTGYLFAKGLRYDTDYLVGDDMQVYIKVKDENGKEWPKLLDQYLLENPSLRYGG